LIPNAEFVPLESKNHLLLNTEPVWPGFIDRLNRFLAQNLAGHADVDFGRLTARERDVLALVAQGRDNNGIASALQISEKTVRNHVSAIFAKLNIGSRAEAVARARGASTLLRT
jgi:DNA-binding NarL/FixJ family response regulator